MIEDRDPRGQRQGLALIVGDEDEGRAELLMQPLHFVLHTAAQVLVERRERLVEQEDGRLEDERARERHALLLAAREFRRQLAFMAVQADALDRSRRRGAQ